MRTFRATEWRRQSVNTRVSARRLTDRQLAEIEAENNRIANLFGLEDHGGCECGRAIDAAGECLAGVQCGFELDRRSSKESGR